MRRLLAPEAEPDPSPGDEPAAEELERLAAAYAYPAREAGPYLRANMVGSLDGAAQYEGRSAPLSSPADMRVFGVLRALADVVVGRRGTARRGRGPRSPGGGPRTGRPRPRPSPW
jgi:hypothetical protein